MEDKSYLRDRIDSYLLNKMTDQEISDFETEIEKDISLKEKVELQRMIISEIQLQEEFYEIIGERPKGMSVRIITLKKTFWYSVSIAAVLIAFFIFVQPQKLSNSKISEQFAYYIPFEKEVYILSKELTRGEECSLPNLSALECKEAKSALIQYNNKEFEQAKRSLSKILARRKKNNELLFYLSLCQIETNELKFGIENLEYLQDQNMSEYIDDINYQLALAYIKNGQNSRARIELKKILSDNGKYAGSARKTLKKLRWF